jgi:hypothetical protein
MSTNTAASNVIAMREFDRPIPSQQAAHFDRILKECQDLACTRLSQSVSGMLDKAEEALWGLANQTPERETRNLYLKAKDKAIAERKVIEEQFRSNYLAEMRKRAQRDKKPEDAFSKYDLSSLELGLVNDDELNETLQTNEMAGKLRRYCEEELIALDQRVGVLVGDATLQGDGNPFSPHAICNAYKLACKHLELELKVLAVFLKLFDDHVLDDIRSIYKDLNGLLVQRSILPKIRYSVGKRNGGAAGGSASAAVLGALLSGVANGAAEAGAGAHGADAGPTGDQDLFSVLQNLLTMNVRGGTSGAPSAGLTAAPPPGAAGSLGNGAAQVQGFPQIFGAPAAGANPLQGAALLGSLTRIQHGDVSGVAAGNVPLAATLVDPGTINVLRELKATSFGSGLGQVDAMTLDIVAMLFDHIFDDRKIPGAMKGLIGRLQIPILKVAIVDKTFFSKKSHPARILLDTLGEFAVGLNADFDHTNALYQSLEKAVQKLIDAFTDSIEIFETTQAEVSRLIAQESARVEEETRRAAKRIEEKESLAVAKAIAQDEIKHRAGTQQMPQAVLKFLTAQWVKLLLVAYAKHGKDSEAWKSALETMDLLIWSVNSKQALEERRKLASLLPGLLKRLNAGMQMIGLESEIRTRFFAKLMKCHTRVMSGAATIVLKPAVTSKTTEPATQASTAPVAQALPNPLARNLTEPPILTELAPPALPSLPSFESSKLASDSDEATRSEGTTVQPLPEVDDTEVAADAPEFSPVTIQNPFGGGEIEIEEISLSDIPLTPGMPQDGHPTPASASGDEHSHMASTLKEGDWVEFRDQDDNRRQAKLSYISPLKGTYLFVNRQGKTVGEFSLYQLAREFRSGNLAVMDEVPLFDRAMSSLVGALRGSATTH